MAQYRMGQAMLIVPAKAVDVGCWLSDAHAGTRPPNPVLDRNSLWRD
jgi:hypothetical protein